MTWDKWWGDFLHRPSAHEGVDITYYRDLKTGRIHHFSDAIKVPAMADGTVLAICHDFLGQTIVSELPEKGTALTRVVFAYAHIVPEKGIRPGDRIYKDQIIANVCDT